jgi:microcystin degradation protein MlrC
MTDRIYLVTQNDTQRLIRAANQAAARSFAARSTISVSVATVDQSIDLAIKGVRVEEIGQDAALDTVHNTSTTDLLGVEA